MFGPYAPYLSYDYSGSGPFGANIEDAKKFTTGGGTIAVFEIAFDTTVLRNYTLINGTSTVQGTHGLAVASIIGGFSYTDSVAGILTSSTEGMAPNAAMSLFTLNVTNKDSQTLAGIAQNYETAISAAGAWVINNSWSSTVFGSGAPVSNPGFATQDYTQWFRALNDAASSGRNRLGTVIVFAAGNAKGNLTGSYAPISYDNASLEAYKSSPTVINVGGIDQNGLPASFSTPGAAVLVSEVAVDVHAATLNNNDPLSLHYTNAGGWDGTSVAAPQISAIVDLMLTANSKLTWLDVQEILVCSAYQPPPSASYFKSNGATNWNGGSLLFSNEEGFGVVDAAVAVHLAAAWRANPNPGPGGFAPNTQPVNATLPGNTATSSLTSGVQISNVGGDGIVTHAEVTISDSGLIAQTSQVVLISPSGFRSVLYSNNGPKTNTNGVLTSPLDVTGIPMTSNAFWGERGNGTWHLEITNTSGQQVQVNSWTLQLWGDGITQATSAPPIPSVDPNAPPSPWPIPIQNVLPLIFTPEFAQLAANFGSSRTVINAEGAAHTLDLIDLPNPTNIDLTGRTASYIDGVNVSIGPGIQEVKANGSTGPVSIHLADGVESNVIGGDGPTTVWAGTFGTDFPEQASDDFVNITAGDGPTTVHANSTVNMWLQAGSGNTTVYDGGGELRIIVGSGHLTLVHSPGSLKSGAPTSSSIDNLFSFNNLSDSIEVVGVSSTEVWTDVAHQYNGSTLTSVSIRNGYQGLFEFEGDPNVPEQVFGMVSLSHDNEGDTHILGTAGANYLQADGSNTFITEQAGDDTIVGGTGDLTVTLAAGSASIDLSSASTGSVDTVMSGLADTTIQGGAGALSVNVGDGDLSVVGSTGDMMVDATTSSGTLNISTESGTTNAVSLGSGAATVVSGGSDTLFVGTQSSLLLVDGSAPAATAPTAAGALGSAQVVFSGYALSDVMAAYTSFSTAYQAVAANGGATPNFQIGGATLEFQPGQTLRGDTFGVLQTNPDGTRQVTDIGVQVHTPGTCIAEAGGMQVGLSGLYVSDLDGAAAVSVTISSANGWLWDNAGLGTETQDPQTGQIEFSITGSLDYVNADLATMSFYAFQVGQAFVSISATDSLGLAAAPKTQEIDVAAPPPPAITISMPATGNVETGQIMSLGGITLQDTDSSSDITFGLYDNYGILAVSAGSSVLQSSTGTGLVLEGSVDAIQATLATLTYTASDSAGNDQVWAYAYDDQGGSNYLWPNDNPSTSITVAQAPLTALKTPYSQQGWVGEDVILNGAFGVAEEDATAEVTATISTSGGTLSMNDGTSVLSGQQIQVTGTADNINAMLSSLSLNDTAAESDTLTLSLSDSDGNIATATNGPIQILKSDLSVTPVASGESLLLGSTYQQSSATAFNVNWTQLNYPDEVVTATVTDSLGQIGSGLFIPTAQQQGIYPSNYDFASSVSQGAGSITIQGSAVQVASTLTCMIYTPGVAGTDTIAVSATDNHGGSSHAESTINVVTSQLGISGAIGFTAAVNEPTTFWTFVSETSSVGFSDAAVTVDMFVDAGALNLPGMTVLGNGGIEVQGGLGQVDSALRQATYTPDGSSANDNITMVARDNHGGYASASIPVVVNMHAA